MSNDFDFSEFQEAPKDTILNKIMEGVLLQEDYAVKVKEATDALKKLKEKQLNHEQFYMPELMKAAGVDDFTRDGKHIKLDEKIRSQISEDRKEDAYKWLEENGEGRLIKANFIVEFDNMAKDDMVKFRNIIGMMSLPFEFKRSHNANSVTATIKKKMLDGVDVPQKTFAVFHQKFCKITKAKVKK